MEHGFIPRPGPGGQVKLHIARYIVLGTEYALVSQSGRCAVPQIVVIEGRRQPSVFVCIRVRRAQAPTREDLPSTPDFASVGAAPAAIARRNPHFGDWEHRRKDSPREPTGPPLPVSDRNSSRTGKHPPTSAARTEIDSQPPSCASTSERMNLEPYIQSWTGYPPISDVPASSSKSRSTRLGVRTAREAATQADWRASGV